jgi:hypothetical protein
MMSVLKKIERLGEKPRDVQLIEAEALVRWQTCIRITQ